MTRTAPRVQRGAPSRRQHLLCQNAEDMLSLPLLQARLIDLKLPIKIAEGT